MPRKQLPSNPMPDWLMAIDKHSVFHGRDVIDGSVYYPGAGLDQSVIDAYSGFAHSFIYVDYDTHHDFIWARIQRLPGYDVLLIKKVNQKDLASNSIKSQKVYRSDFYPNFLEEEPITKKLNRLNNRIKDGITQAHDGMTPDFFIWVVYQRRITTNSGCGPERLSLLYIWGEGVDTYNTIFNSNRLRPLAIVIKSVDRGNWTLFEQRGGIFERVVMDNEAGIPDYLFADWRYSPQYHNECNTDSPYWERYTTRLPDRKFLKIWSSKIEDVISLNKSNSKKMSRSFIHWYNERVLAIWDECDLDHPYLPKVLSGCFDIDAPVCYVGMNPSYVEREISKMMDRPEFEGFTPHTLHHNSLSDRDRRVNLLKLLEGIAINEYPYFKTIKDFNESLELGFQSISFLDLFLVRKTSQCDVQELIKRFDKFKSLQINLFLESIERINTKFVCVLNAGASKHLCDHLNKEQTALTFKYKGKVLFFAGMLSGSRAMDRFSRERLRLNMREVITHLGFSQR